MPQYRKFNINSYIRIKPTARGHEVWRQYLVGLGLEPSPLEVDADGWARMQAWEVMQRFGPRIGNGLSVPFETEIEVEFED